MSPSASTSTSDSLPTIAPTELSASDSLLSQTLSEYHLSRQSLISHERNLRHDHSFRSSLSPTARRACTIVSKIRTHESRTIWSRPPTSPELLEEGFTEEEAAEEVFSGMMFTLAKHRMEKTLLWKIVKRLPKGALLHAHFEAMVEVGWVLHQAMKVEGMCVYVDRWVRNRKDLETVDVKFMFVPHAELEKRGNVAGIFEKDYVPNTPIPLKAAVESFPTQLFPPDPDPTSPTRNCPPHFPHPTTPGEAFLHWIYTRSTITPHESLLHHEGIDKIWKKFQSIFSVLSGLTFYEPLFRKFTRHLLRGLHADGISWVEMRMAFHMQFQEEGTGRILPLHEVVRVYKEEVDKYVALTEQGLDGIPDSDGDEEEDGKAGVEWAGYGEGNGRTGTRETVSLYGPFWGSRIIWTTLRILPREVIRENMDACLLAKKLHPEPISGFDLVGYENAGRPLLSHLPDLLWFQQQQKLTTSVTTGSTTTTLTRDTIPFFFHAGETLNDHDPTDHNLYDAVLLHTRRIGHGFTLFRHPHLMSLCKNHQPYPITIEMCPISNEILRLTGSILHHPLPAVIAMGGKVAISNDDPGVLGQKVTGGVSHDCWQVLAAFGGVGLAGIGDMCRNSVGSGWYTDEDWVGVSAEAREALEGWEGNGAHAKEKQKRLSQWDLMWERFCEWIVREFSPEWPEERIVEGVIPGFEV